MRKSTNSAYGVQTRALNQSVRRNAERFPEDFIFQLTEEEKQEVIAVCEHLPKLKYAPQPPYAFTEYGAVMVASILNSPRAIHVSVYVIRVFIKLRWLLAENRGLSERMHALEQKLERHDGAIRSLAVALRELIEPTLPNKLRRIGF